MKNIVKLREKQLSDGSKSLYLDYVYKGRRKYEYLKLYLNPGTDRKTKELNRTAMEAAQTIQAERIVQIQQGAANIGQKESDVRFIEFIDEWMSLHEGQYSRGTVNASVSVKRSWGDFVRGDDYRIVDITPDVIRKYLASLNRRASTKHAYLSTISTYLNRAVRQGIIQINPCSQLERNEKPKKISKPREFLSLEEVDKLARTPYVGKFPDVKNAFMFSCFTGLRLSDIMSLTWDMIKDNCIVKQQIKTKEVVRIPLSENALAWLPDREHRPNEPVFNMHAHQKYMEDWIYSADLGKHVSFHCARHTFATLLITYGVDLYTVSKLLGHTKISTTEIYAKVLDRKKAEAVRAIPKI